MDNALEHFYRILANCVSSGSSNTCSSTNNNHRHNVPSTTTNCQTTSQSSNQLSTSYGKYSSGRTKKVRDQTKQAKNSNNTKFFYALRYMGFFRSYFLNCQCNSRFQKTLIYWLDPIQKSPLDPDNNLNYYFWPEKTLSSK